MDLGVLVASSPRLLHPAALDGHKDHDDGGEDADNHRGDPDSDEVLLLEPFLNHILGSGVNILLKKALSRSLEPSKPFIKLLES